MALRTRERRILAWGIVIIAGLGVGLGIPLAPYVGGVPVVFFVMMMAGASLAVWYDSVRR